MFLAFLFLVALARPPAGAFAVLRCTDVGQVTVSVRETADEVRLDIHLPPGSDPGLVEVMLDAREVTVVAQDAAGRQIRSAPIVLREPAIEAGATADYDGDGRLTITLRRREP